MPTTTSSTTNNRSTMSSRDYAAMNCSYDRKTAREMVAAISYIPTAEETAYAEALEQDRKDRKAAKKARKQYLASDNASVSSFGSTVGLLKSKLSRKSRQYSTADKEKSKQTSQMMKYQVNFVG